MTEDRIALLETVLGRTRTQLADAMARIAELEAVIALHNAKAEGETTPALS